MLGLYEVCLLWYAIAPALLMPWQNIRHLALAQEGLQLMEAVLGSWKLMAKLKEYCEANVDTPFTMDLWTQIGRFAHLVRGSSRPYTVAATKDLVRALADDDRTDRCGERHGLTCRRASAAARPFYLRTWL